MKELVSRDQLCEYPKLIWLVVFFATSAAVAGVIATYYSRPLNTLMRKFLFSY